jgi:hypothetical protein
MGSSTGTSSPTPEPLEPERRRPWASGTPVRLADGATWLLARPVFRPRRGDLTRPGVDPPLDRIFDKVALGEGVDLQDVWEAAWALLRANYHLTDDELSRLLSVAPGEESRCLADSVLEALFGPGEPVRTYSNWVRASLLANGLGESDIPAADLPNVLAVLVATGRTVPVDRFVDACEAANECACLESLV